MSFFRQTARLYLRDYEEGDQTLIRALFLDPRLRHFHLRDQSHEHYVAQFGWQAAAQARAQVRRVYDLTIVLNFDQTAIGCCSLQLNAENPAHGTLSWHILPKHWAQGYATEAALALLAFGFSELGCERLEARTFADNAASLRVMEKLKMRPVHNQDITAWWRGLQAGASRPVVCYQLPKQQWLVEASGSSPNQPLSLSLVQAA